MIVSLSYGPAGGLSARIPAQTPGDTCRVSGVPVRRLSAGQRRATAYSGRRGDLDEAVGLGEESLRCGRRSVELLPRAAELERRLAARYGAERLVNEYGELLREEFRALPPGDARRLDEAVGRRLDGRALP